LTAIRGYGLQTYISKEQRKPEQWLRSDPQDEPTINPEFLFWMRQDQILASWILSSLSESLLVTTVGLTTSREIWESLEVSFSSQSKAKILQLKLKLQTLKKGSLSMRDYLNQVKACCNTLAAAELPINKEEQAMHILAGLGQEYNPVMVSIMSKTYSLMLRDVQSLLLSFETRLETFTPEGGQYNTDGSSPSINFAAHTSQNERGNYSNRGRGN
ncbi:Unknown protein, partial [Striga hermonthica]